RGKVERRTREFDDQEIVTNKIILLSMEPLGQGKKIEKISLSLRAGGDYKKIKSIVDNNPGDIDVEIEYKSIVIKTRIKVDQTKKFLIELAGACNIQEFYAA